MSEEPNELLVVLCAFPNVEDAGGAAHTLVAEGLCACVNILPHIRSIYKWQGEIANSAETLCLIKTTTSRFPALSARLQELHSYDIPEIVAIPSAAVNEAYLRWVQTEVHPQQAPDLQEAAGSADR